MDFDPKRHRLKMIDAMRYVAGSSRNIPTRNMLRHLQRSGLIDVPEPVNANKCSLTRDGERVVNQAKDFYSRRVVCSDRGKAGTQESVAAGCA